ncbi:MAG TPA: substrate-binding domain-containing protein [Phycisphaerae bacterium]|nr:substrate-binding domain-containing protein [Phycisphaerae bacterium]
MNTKIGKLLGIMLAVLVLAAGTAHGDNQKKVALVMKALTNPFFNKMQIGAKEYATAAGVPLEVFGVDRETDVERQISIMDNLISRGYAAIVLAPADSKKLVPVCKKAVERGIVVINIDNPLDKETLRQAGVRIPFVGSDNSRGAGMVGQYVRRRLGGKGRVLVIEGIRGAENADLRKSGFIKAVTTDSEIQIVASESANWHTDEAFALVSRLLREKGPVDAIFCANDSMALGALRALDLSEPGRKVTVGSYDNIEAVRNEMRNGRIHATIEQHPELMGAYGVELAAHALSGGKAPETTPTPLDLITYESFGKKISLCISRTDTPFFDSLAKGAKKAADLFGAELDISDSGNDDAKQLTCLKNHIDAKVDAVIVNPTNSERVVPGIELANTAGIPIFTVDRAATGGKVLAHITSDNLEGGRLAAECLAKLLGDKGRVLELEGTPGTTSAHDRGLGFEKALVAHPGIKIVARRMGDFDRARARKAVAQVLAEGIAFDAVFAHNDEMILGALQAFEDAKAPRPILVGFDAIPEAVKQVQSGKLNATIAQQPETLGWLAVDAVVKHLRGEEFPPSIHVALKLISR